VLARGVERTRQGHAGNGFFPAGIVDGRDRRAKTRQERLPTTGDQSMDPGSSDCQLGAGARMGAGPSRFGSSLSAVGDDDDEEPPLERLDAFPGRVDMTSPPVVPLSRDPPPWE
jgi:hypothetical protein